MALSQDAALRLVKEEKAAAAEMARLVEGERQRRDEAREEAKHELQRQEVLRKDLEIKVSKAREDVGTRIS